MIVIFGVYTLVWSIFHKMSKIVDKVKIGANQILYYLVMNKRIIQSTFLSNNNNEKSGIPKKFLKTH